MRFSDHQYDLHVILGDPSKPPAWQHKEWMSLQLSLNPLVTKIGGKPGVRSLQYDPKGKKVPFRGLTWSTPEKWTHDSPITHNDSEKWSFIHTEIWAPTWSACERRYMPPDLFISLSSKGSKDIRSSFNPILILAFRSEAVGETESRTCAMKCANSVGSLLHAWQHRPWGFLTQNDRFFDAIQDMPYVGLLHPSAHEQPPSLDSLKTEHDGHKVDWIQL